MRLLAFADEPPPDDAVILVAHNHPDAVITLGDLQPAWIDSLSDVDVPRLGVHGNHDGEHQLQPLGISDLHLSRAALAGWTFVGFEGAPRHGGGGPHQYTQDEARRLAHGLPPADVLLCHAPPWGLSDEPDDPAHDGFRGLRDWVEEHEPRYVIHGHTTPDPRNRIQRLGRTEIMWVRGARTIELRR